MSRERAGSRVVVHPSRAALKAAESRAARRAGGMVWVDPAFTMESLLPRVLEMVPASRDQEPLSDLAGVLLVQRLIAESDVDLGIYHGLAAGRRLPWRLWRLMVEIKATGLDAAGVAGLATDRRPRLAALARLMERYQSELDRLGLADQADQAAGLEKRLARHGPPRAMRGWAELIAERVLWMRPLDIRLLRTLSHLLPVEVRFCLAPGRTGLASLHSLLAHTAEALESPGKGRLTVRWNDLADNPNPLASLAAAHLDPAHAPASGAGRALDLVRTAGRYGLAEELTRRALVVLEDGADPEEVVIAFPDLAAYGPMLADAAARLRLPLDMAPHAALADAPVVEEVLALAELALGGCERQALAGVVTSPLVGQAMARRLGGERAPGLERVETVLARAGYVDDRATPLAELRDRLGDNNKELYVYMLKVKLEADKYAQSSDITDYCVLINRLVQELRPLSRPQPQDPAWVRAVNDLMGLGHGPRNAGGRP